MVQAVQPLAFEPEFVQVLTHISEEAIVFNKTLGLKITWITPQGVSGSIQMRPELVGHPS